MEKTILYFIRHGQSEGNLRDLFLGHTDMDLTPLGHRQAELAATYFDGIKLDCIYSSDLKRAYHTACHTAEKKGLPVITDPDLREVFAGEWEGLSFPQLIERYPESFDRWRFDFGASYCDGGESIEELFLRMTSAVKRIAEKHEGKSIAIFSHATPIRLLKGWGDGVDLSEMNDVPWPANASVTAAEYENGTFRILEYSIDSFMGDLVTRLD